VLFVNDFDGGDGERKSIFEVSHNEWFPTHDMTKTRWKVIIYDGSLVVSVYHHSISDGLWGFTFHRSLLAALNGKEVSPTSLDRSTNRIPSVADMPNKAPHPCPLDQIEDKFLGGFFIYGFLFWQILRLFFNEKYSCSTQGMLTSELT
jgi:hypothetical protein